jgi:hypothetical protein
MKASKTTSLLRKKNRTFAQKKRTEFSSHLAENDRASGRTRHRAWTGLAVFRNPASQNLHSD